MGQPSHRPGALDVLVRLLIASWSKLKDDAHAEALSSQG